MLMLGTRSVIGNSFTREKDVIRVVLVGPQTKEIAQVALADFKRLVREVVQEGTQPFVYVDLQELQLSDVSVDARLAMKEAFQQPYMALAAVGRARLLEVAMYLIGSSRAEQRVRYFTSEGKAWRWLSRKRIGLQERTHGTLIAACVTILVGCVGLGGWLFKNPYLTRFVTDVRPINPMAAVGLLCLGLGLGGSWYVKQQLRIGAAVSVLLLGIFALVPVHTNIDYWLFAAQVHAAGTHVVLGDSAAISFMLFGIVLLLPRQAGRRVETTSSLLAVVVLLLALLNAYGLAYAPSVMYGMGTSFVMALPVSMAFAICSCAVILENISWHRDKAVYRQTSRAGLLIIAALVLIQVATYNSWKESEMHLQNSAAAAFSTRAATIGESMMSRLAAYADALHGFRDLYAVNTYINQGKFEAYYRTTGIATKYPGVRAVSFIASVPTGELPAYIAQHRMDTSLVPIGNPNLTIHDQSTSPIHYIVTYIAGMPLSSSFGTDLADNISRAAAFAKAQATNDIVASGTVAIGAPSRDGFFVTIPVQAPPVQLSTSSLVGFVNVVFVYNELFTNIFNHNASTTDVGIRIFDAADTTKPIYTSGHIPHPAFSQTMSIPVADRFWRIAVTAPSDFAASPSQRYQPLQILISGQLLTLLLGVIFLLQSNARRRALQLADTITVDLQRERDQAVQTKQKDEAIFSDIAEGLIIFDKDARIIRINKATEELLGYTEAALTRRTKDQLLKVYTIEGAPLAIDERPEQQSIRTAKATRQRLRYQRKDTSFIEIELACSPLISGDNVQGAVAVFRDITEQERVERSKSEFVSLASHQLRTPISAISWFSEMLLSNDAGTLSAEQREYVTQVYTSNRRSAAIVDAMLLASGLELGNLPSHPKPVNIKKLLRDSVAECQKSLPVHKELRITQSYDDTATVQIDPRLAAALFGSVISNAIKYTPSGGTISISAEMDTTQHTLKCTVTDTGYGIPKADQKHVFEKLFRASNVKAKDTDGTGLGLYIAKLIVEHLGGSITFTSAPHEGTTFTIRVPAHNKTIYQQKGNHV